MNKEQCQAFKAIPGIKSVWIVFTAADIHAIFTTQEKAREWIDYMVKTYPKAYNRYQLTVKELDNPMS